MDVGGRLVAALAAAHPTEQGYIATRGRLKADYPYVKARGFDEQPGVAGADMPCMQCVGKLHIDLAYMRCQSSNHNHTNCVMCTVDHEVCETIPRELRGIAQHGWRHAQKVGRELDKLLTADVKRNVSFDKFFATWSHKVGHVGIGMAAVQEFCVAFQALCEPDSEIRTTHHESEDLQRRLVAETIAIRKLAQLQAVILVRTARNQELPDQILEAIENASPVSTGQDAPWMRMEVAMTNLVNWKSLEAQPAAVRTWVKQFKRSNRAFANSSKERRRAFEDALYEIDYYPVRPRGESSKKRKRGFDEDDMTYTASSSSLDESSSASAISEISARNQLEDSAE